MNFLQAFVLGIIEGLTEFIPVSSTAHLLVGQQLLGIPADDVTFSFTVIVQIGAVVSLVIYFWKELWTILRNLFLDIFKKQPIQKSETRLGWYILLAMLPVLAIGFLLRGIIAQMFNNPIQQAAIRLLITALLLVLAELRVKHLRTLNELTWQDALWIGFAQVLAVFPGASRSGAAIFGGMMRNFDRASATRFAFLLSIPVLSAAGAYEMLKVIRMSGTMAFLPILAAGFAAAVFSGYIAIRWLVKFMGRHSWYGFAGYCAIFGIVLLAFSLAS